MHVQRATTTDKHLFWRESSPSSVFFSSPFLTFDPSETSTQEALSYAQMAACFRPSFFRLLRYSPQDILMPMLRIAADRPAVSTNHSAQLRSTISRKEREEGRGERERETLSRSHQRPLLPSPLPFLTLLSLLSLSHSPFPPFLLLQPPPLPLLGLRKKSVQILRAAAAAAAAAATAASACFSSSFSFFLSLPLSLAIPGIEKQSSSSLPRSDKAQSLPWNKGLGKRRRIKPKRNHQTLSGFVHFFLFYLSLSIFFQK